MELFLRRLVRKMMDAPKDGQGGGGESGKTGDPNPSSNTDPNPKPQTLTMTQEEFDKKITERLNRQEANLKKKWEEDLEAKRKEAEMTDTEKAKKAAEEAQKDKESIEAESKKKLAKAEAKVAASALGVTSEAMQHLLKLVDLDGVTFDESGDPDSESVKTAVQKVLNDIPGFITKKMPNSDGGQRGSTGLTIEQLGEMSMDDYIKARNANK